MIATTLFLLACAAGLGVAWLALQFCGWYDAQHRLNAWAYEAREDIQDEYEEDVDAAAYLEQLGIY